MASSESVSIVLPEAKRFDAALTQLLGRVLGPPATPLVQALGRAGILLEGGPDQIFARLGTGHALRTSLHGLIKVLRASPGGQPFGRTLAPLDKALATHLVFAGLQRFAAQQLNPTAGTVGHCTRIRAHDMLNADVLAAFAFDCGLSTRSTGHLDSEAEAGKVLRPVEHLFVQNCLRAAPAVEYGAESGGANASVSSVYFAWLEELSTWARSVRSAPLLMQRSVCLTSQRLAQAGPVNSQQVAEDLAEIAERQGILPFITADHSALDERVARQLRQVLQVHSHVRVPHADDETTLDTLGDEAAIAGLLLELHLAMGGPVNMLDADSGTIQASSAGPAKRNKVFISYAHADGTKWMKKLVLHFNGLRGGEVDVWDDRRIAVGDAWRQEIEQAMQSAMCAVLIISPAFLASKFVNDVELTELLLRHKRTDGRFRLLPIHVEPSLLKDRPDLNWLQVEAAEQTLDQRSPARQKVALRDFASTVIQHVLSQAGEVK